MGTKRYGAACAVLDGRLYVAGGHDGTNALSSVERYSPSSNTWEALQAMGRAARRHAREAWSWELIAARLSAAYRASSS